MSKLTNLTPMMRQYFRIKEQHRDAILLFQMGDFYEMFYEDAREAAAILNIALTSRDRHKETAVPLCGIPCHAADSYISRLLEAGRRVAICDQVEDSPSEGGLVKREVTRVITPGTVLDDRLLEGKSNNFLLSLCPERSVTGLAAVDLSTGEFRTLEVPTDNLSELEDRISYFAPSEILVSEAGAGELEALLSRVAPQVAAPTLAGPGKFDFQLSREALLSHFRTATLEVFGCEEMTAGVAAAGALLSYVQETQRRPLANIVSLTPFARGDTLIIDTSSQRNLELLTSLETGRREGSLLGVLDRTATSMGGRKLRSWILTPLTDVKAIESRLNAVGELVGDTAARGRLRSQLKEVYDLERLGSRIALSSCTPRDLASLRDSLRVLPDLPRSLSGFTSDSLRNLQDLDLLADVLEKVEERLVEEPPLKLKEGGLIREGFSGELDDLRRISTDARNWLSEYERQERERTGVHSLKVGFNKIHGYYIEVTRANIASVPDEYARKQTLVNAERFHTPELREFETRVLGAEGKIAALEQRLFEDLRGSLASEAARLQKTASDIATVDVLQSLAEIAVERSYCRPVVDGGPVLRIEEGRHPVVEAAGQERFVPNDCHLDAGGCQIMIITGPNMAGKSTYLRQTALISLMAQMGSFVPAREALVGVADRIFTRIGAADKLSRGQSTFMVEMVETASILHHSTERSLVILDEMGRGTSTFDGLSIAWAVVEALHGSASRGARTLFATHYHHLTELPLTLERARNYNIAVREWEGKILFLRKIVEGGTDKSYGIHVAQLAGMPPETVARSREILSNIERSEFNLDGVPQIAQKVPAEIPDPPLQMEIFPSRGEEVLQRLRSLDLDETTPLEALSILAGLKEDIDKKRDSG
jgi:DNA mismatch repair protein MutS